jgi:hypothetical protein
MGRIRLNVVNMGVGILKGTFSLFRVDAWSIVLESVSVVYVINIENSTHILLDQFEDLLEYGEIGLGFLLDLENDLILEDEAGVKEGLVVANELFADALPHVVELLVVVVDVEDIPALHKGSVLRQERVLHVLEVVFRHLIVHLVLECL